METVTQSHVTTLAERADPMSPPDVLRLALDTFGRRVALSSSFGAEDMVLIDMLMKIDPKARIFTLDTGRLPQETYNVIDATREKYGAMIEVFFPQPDAVQNMVAEHGMNLFYHSVENRKLCCGVRKMEPLRRALSTLNAWITGLRREQSVTRTAVRKIEWDESNQLVKANPLVEWTQDEVWQVHPREQRAVQRAARSRVSQYWLRAVHQSCSAGRG